MRRNQTARKAQVARKPRAKATPAPETAPTPPSEPENGPVAPSEPEDFAAIVEAEQARPRVNDAGQVEIECIIPNVHLGDGRQLGRGERAFVSPDIAELIVGKDQAVYV